MTNPKLLVVGGTGFIGQHVVGRGIKMGWDVTSLGTRSQKAASRISGANYLIADLTQLETLICLRKCNFDFVVNLGGYIDHSPLSQGGRNLIDAHFDGVLNLLQSLDRTNLKRFVQVGSSDEYGGAPAPQHEGLREGPISPYAQAKLAATHLLQMMHRAENFPAVVLRLFLTYGPGQGMQRFLPQVISGCLNNSNFPVSEGVQIRDFCYVEDVVDAIFMSFDQPRVNGHVLNIASGKPIQIREVITEIIRQIGTGSPQYGQLAYRQGESMALVANVDNAKHLLGWTARTSLADGLRNTIEFMKTHAGYRA
jgi:nucleoside-diphosphate-sugar epimerase